MAENNAPRPPQQPGSDYQTQTSPGTSYQTPEVSNADYSYLDQSHLYAQQPHKPLNPSESQHYDGAIQQTTSKKAIASLVLGIIGILAGVFIPFIGLIGIILAIIGIVLAALSMKETRRPTIKGRGLGIAGLVCSIIALLATLFVQGSLIFIMYVVASNPEISQDLNQQLQSDPELSQMLEDLAQDSN